jgi:hypothetical protein
MQFVLVNDRSPLSQSFCTLCCEPIQEGYVREIATRLSYCGHKCYFDHCFGAALVFGSKRRTRPPLGDVIEPPNTEVPGPALRLL